MAGLYAYGIIGATEKEDFGEAGPGHSGRLYPVTYEDIAVVVSDSPLEEYDLTEENAMTHDRIVARVFEEHTVLPMAFSQVFKNKEVLLSLLKASQEVLKDALRRFHNNVELGVKVLIPRDGLKSPEALFNGKTREQFIKDCASEFMGTLGEFAVSSTEGVLFSPRLALNASFLVARDKVDRFLAVLEGVDAKYKFVTTRLSGPLPPYNFCRIKLARAAELA